MSSEKLIYMANQIATFFASQPEAGRVQRVADHINDFWDPAMRRQFVALAADKADELHPLVREAIALVRVPA